MPPRASLLVLASLAGAALAARPAAEALASYTIKAGRAPTWSTETCAAFLGEVGFSSATTDAVVAQGVTGDLLAEWTDTDALAITSGADKTRWKTVQRALKESASSSPSTTAKFSAPGSPLAGPASDHNLWHLRDLDRWGFYSTLTLLQTLPRPTLWYLHTHNAQTGQPNALHMFDGHPESAAFTMWEWVLFPEAIIARHFDGFKDTNPIYAWTLSLCALLIGIGNVGTVVNALANNGMQSLIAVMVGQASAGVLTYAVSYVFWPITPGFLIDLSLYCMPVTLVLGLLAGLVAAEVQKGKVS